MEEKNIKTTCRELCDISAKLLKIAARSENLVDVVRCKDCKYLNKADHEENPDWCEAWEKVITENGFCHKGRRV